jgi:hypothetical protein
MKAGKWVLLAVAAALLPAAQPPADLSFAEKSAHRLGKLLKGRVSGPPQNCIQVVKDNRLSTYEYLALVYQTKDTVYVSWVRNPEGLRRDYKPLIGMNGFRLCASEIGIAVNKDGFTSRIEMTPFFPYTKPRD